MKRLVLALLLSTPLGALADADCGSSNSSAPCTGTSHTHAVDGITFTWNYTCNGGSCQHGRFLDGTAWVRNPNGGSVTITSVTPDDAASGLEKNPATGSEATSFSQGLFANPGSDSSYNAALDLSTQLPYAAAADDGVYVKAKAFTGGDCGYTSAVGSRCLDSFDAITVVRNLPSDGSLGRSTFRPGMAGNTKVWLTTADVDLSRLPRFSAISPGNYSQIKARWGSPYPAFYIGLNGDNGRRWTPHARLASKDYAADQAEQNLSDMYGLFSNDSLSASKTAAVYAMMQYGLDLYSGYMEGVEWVTGAGQGQGHWHPIVFLGALVKDSTVQANVRRAAEGANVTGDGSNVQFTELHQVRPGAHGHAIWGGAPGSSATSDGCRGGASGNGVYWSDYAEAVLRNGTGKRTCGDPYGYVDGIAEGPGEVYASCCSSGVYISIGLVMKIWPQFDAAANYPEMREFAERVMDGAGWWTAEDQVAIVDPRESRDCNPYTESTASSTCVYFGRTWGQRGDGSAITIADARAAGHPSAGPRWAVATYHLKGRPSLDRGQPGMGLWDEIKGGGGTPTKKPSTPSVTGVQ